MMYMGGLINIEALDPTVRVRDWAIGKRKEKAIYYIREILSTSRMV